MESVRNKDGLLISLTSSGGTFSSRAAVPGSDSLLHCSMILQSSYFSGYIKWCMGQTTLGEVGESEPRAGQTVELIRSKFKVVLRLVSRA